MLRIDLHTHSSCSDGTDAPAELLAAGADAGLDVLGLTDHDTFEGWAEAEAAVADTGVALVRGVEMSCSAEGVTVHLLGLLPNPDSARLVAVLDKSRTTRRTRARAMVERLAEDFPITWEDVRCRAAEDGPVGRPHIADALVEAGAFADRSAAFRGALHPSGPYYVHHWAPDPVEAVEIVLEAGGVPVLAHPRARARQRLLPEETIAAMAEAGLFGIERDHRDHAAEDREAVDALARGLGLALFGSSDYHGAGKPNRLGENLTSPEVFDEVEARGCIEVVRP
ncbi:PHP domain-containing protein [Schaalia sp.]|uniref:PHP domain-containing protein n=1 Tax=Schaalia sp. TaxID=2691890 RepID=UPI003D14C082